MNTTIDIGDNHNIELTYFKNELSGLNYLHLDQENKICKGWIPFSNTAGSKEF